MRNYIKAMLIIGLFFISFGGLLLHSAVHPAARNLYGYIPLAAGIISAIAIPVLFIFRKTLHLAYILNSFMVIIGVITMAHFSIVKHPIIPDIIVLLCKFMLGRALFCFELYQLDAPMKPQGWRWIRYPNMGFWWVHLVMLSAVYFLGNHFWR